MSSDDAKLWIDCPMCGAAIRVPRRFSGKRGSCPKCGEEFVAPAGRMTREPPKVELIFEPPPPEPETPPPKIVTQDYSVAIAKRHPPSRFRKKESVAIVGSLAGLGLTILVFWHLTSPGPQSVGELAARDDAWLAREAVPIAQAAVRENLAAPSTASFPRSEGKRGSAPSNLRFAPVWVKGEVEAQNAFGVPLRHNFVAVVAYHLPEEKWHPLCVMINDSFHFQDRDLFQELVAAGAINTPDLRDFGE